MEPVSVILAALAAGLKAANAIQNIVKDLKDFPVIIQSIHDQVQQVTHRLKHLSAEVQARTLRLDMLEAWFGYQQTCNRALNSIQEILSSYAKRSKSKLAILNFAKYEFLFGKDKLAELLKSITESNNYFQWLSESILKASLTSDLMVKGMQRSTAAVPVLSLGQYADMVMREEAAAANEN